MGMFSVGEATRFALAGLHDRSQARSGNTQRLGSRALQGSIEAGTFEDAFFAVPVKGETDHLLRVARRTLDAGRRLRRDARSGDRILHIAGSDTDARHSIAVGADIEQRQTFGLRNA